MTEICNICGKSVEWGSGKYVNRAPDFNDREIRLNMGRPFPEGDFVCAECDTKREKQTWEMWTLSEDGIREIAKQKKLSLNGIDFDDVAHYVKKGIQAALDNWDEIIYNAIRNVKAHPVCVDCSGELDGSTDIQLCNSCTENYNMDRIWALLDENKLEVLEFNEKTWIREQFRKQR